MEKSKLNDVFEEEKLLLLDTFLKNAPFEHWNNKNLEISEAECGLPANYTTLLFHNKVEGLTDFFHQTLNSALTRNFLESNNFARVSDKIAYLIELKLDLYNKHRKAIPYLLQYNLSPQNICHTRQLLWETCDLIWSLAGDKSTDHNYYTKRILLSYVYSSSVMFWISDESKNYAETKVFIKHKIQEILKIGRYKESVIRFFKKLVE